MAPSQKLGALPSLPKFDQGLPSLPQTLPSLGDPEPVQQTPSLPNISNPPPPTQNFPPPPPPMPTNTFTPPPPPPMPASTFTPPPPTTQNFPPPPPPPVGSTFVPPPKPKDVELPNPENPVARAKLLSDIRVDNPMARLKKVETRETPNMSVSKSNNSGPSAGGKKDPFAMLKE